MMAAAAATAVKVLLVEDDADTRDALAKALRTQGFEVDATASAGAALAQLETGHTPAAALVDLGLPDADGSLVLWRIRRGHGRRVPVAIITALPDPHERPELVRERPDVIFRKPLSVKSLVAWLKSVT